MSYDCCIEKDKNWFRYRTGGILIHDGKMLFVKSKIGGYYYMIGGGVHMGERSDICIEREIYEETGMEAKVDRLSVVCENFFKCVGGAIDGYDCHTIELYYYMKITGNSDLCKPYTDDGEELVWLPLEEIADADIKPSFMKDLIDRILTQEQVIHVIQETDR